MSEPTPFGRYVLLDQLAIGGMAELHLAKVVGAAGFERICAIKRVLPEFAQDTAFINRFLDEARLAAKLSHPGIVQVFDLGKQDNSYFIAMEYLAGENLSEVIKQARNYGHVIPIDVAARLISSASEALHHAHTAKDSSGGLLCLVHRDVTPSNLILTYDGVLKIVDFGIAKAAASREATRMGVVLGKAPYMSPERVNMKTVDHRDDIWGLGVCLHELLTVQRAFARSNTRASMQAVLSDAAPPPSATRPDVPPELDAIVLKALNKDPAQRHQSARELRDELEAFLSSRGGGPQPKDLAQFLVKMFGEEREREMRLRRSGDYPANKAAVPTGAVEVVSADLIPPSLEEEQLTDVPLVQEPPTNRREPPRGLWWLFVAAALAGMAVVGAAKLLWPKTDEAVSLTAPSPVVVPVEARDPEVGREEVKDPAVADAVPGEQEAELESGAEAVKVPVVADTTADVTADQKPIEDVKAEVVADQPPVEEAKSDVAVDQKPVEEETPPKDSTPTKTVAASAELAVLNLTANVRAAASIDGGPLSALPWKGRQLRAGTHQLRIVDKEHGGQRTLKVEVESGKTADRHVTFGKGTLAVHSDPWAEVTVDGKQVGQTPLGGIELWEGPHVVKLKTSLGEKTKKVQIRENKSEVIREKWR